MLVLCEWQRGNSFTQSCKEFYVPILSVWLKCPTVHFLFLHWDYGEVFKKGKWKHNQSNVRCSVTVVSTVRTDLVLMHQLMVLWCKSHILDSSAWPFLTLRQQAKTSSLISFIYSLDHWFIWQRKSVCPSGLPDLDLPLILLMPQFGYYS